MALHLPEEFDNYMKSRLGSDFNNFHTALEQPPPVSIRVNPLKLIQPSGSKVPWSQYGYYLEERPVFTLDPAFHAGAYYVQEASSMFLEQALLQCVDLKKSLNVLDLCAAPGGKSTHALSLLSSDSLLISNDVIRSRASVLSENIQKWGTDNVIVTNSDPADFNRIPDFFDLIILDAPCSGEGLFRKDPHAVNEWSPKNVDLCSLRQRRIVGDVWSSLRPGGTLIYSTCTYNQKENLENLQWIYDQGEASFLKLSVPKEWNVETIGSGSCIGYQLFPHKVRGEGFFLSVIRKSDDRNIQSLKSKDRLNYPTKAQVKDFSEWVQNSESQNFFLHNQTVRMMPNGKTAELNLALNHLNVLSAGTAVLEIMKNKFVPDHALAMSLRLNKGNFNTLSVSREEALDYLSKNQMTSLPENLGFTLVEFEGLPLGWVNVLQNRLNNLYPASWRIRMGH
ncbi:MAG: rRNA methyltransferase [Cyclobacteriaceae bacterium]|nr:rRNA methyltransferase [Cyclobacteriaceae bacterium]